MELTSAERIQSLARATVHVKSSRLGGNDII